MTEPDGHSFALGILTDVSMGDAIVEYLKRIDATLVPYDGRFLIHGAEAVTVEGVSPGTIVVIEFPTRSGATDWYHSPAYQAIVPLRAGHSTSVICLVDGVPPGHAATDVLSAT